MGVGSGGSGFRTGGNSPEEGISREKHDQGRYFWDEPKGGRFRRGRGIYRKGRRERIGRDELRESGRENQRPEYNPKLAEYNQESYNEEIRGGRVLLDEESVQGSVLVGGCGFSSILGSSLLFMGYSSWSSEDQLYSIKGALEETLEDGNITESEVEEKELGKKIEKYDRLVPDVYSEEVYKLTENSRSPWQNKRHVLENTEAVQKEIEDIIEVHNESKYAFCMSGSLLLLTGIIAGAFGLNYLNED